MPKLRYTIVYEYEVRPEDYEYANLEESARIDEINFIDAGPASSTYFHRDEIVEQKVEVVP